jgi:hypothetical protein
MDWLDSAQLRRKGENDIDASKRAKTSTREVAASDDPIGCILSRR